jgi:hypothetical protein
MIHSFDLHTFHGEGDEDSGGGDGDVDNNNNNNNNNPLHHHTFHGFHISNPITHIIFPTNI